MKTLRPLLAPFWPLLLVAVLAGGAASISTVALLAVINDTLQAADGLSERLALGFAALCGATLVSRAVSDITINMVGQRLVAHIRRLLARRILAAPLDALERYRTHRLIPILTHDVDMVSDVAFVAAGFAISVTIVLGCLGYLAVLSLPLFAVTLLVLGLGTVGVSLARQRGVRGFWEARAHEDSLHKAYRVMTEGAKELRLHRARRDRLRDTGIGGTVTRIQTVNQRAINTFVIANACGAALFFLVIALVFGWAALVGGITDRVLSGFVLVLLYMKGPVDQMMQSLANVSRAQVAFRHIADVTDAFATPEPQIEDAAQAPPATAIRDGLALRGVTYAFSDGSATPFMVGPVDLTIRAGEILFIVGANGSGKTTLIKLLLGLYRPQGGQVLLDGRTVDDRGRDGYRQLFTTIFSDSFLFEDFQATGADAEAARGYLDRLEIAHKVSIRDGGFSTTDLSTGQRKRLALVQAYLEDRPVMIFDEWAADQDPAFRHVFYTALLPELRRRGKTVIVVSHDDRYFGVADRVAHMRDGRIDSIDIPTPLAGSRP